MVCNTADGSLGKARKEERCTLVSISPNARKREVSWKEDIKL